jgi:hypothetical protein
MFNDNLMIAVVAALVNYLLSMIIPSLFKESKLPLADEIRKNFECNKDVMMVSSLLTAVFVLISLQITPTLSGMFFSGLAKTYTSPQLVPM